LKPRDKKSASIGSREGGRGSLRTGCGVSCRHQEKFAKQENSVSGGMGAGKKSETTGRPGVWDRPGDEF